MNAWNLCFTAALNISLVACAVETPPTPKVPHVTVSPTGHLAVMPPGPCPDWSSNPSHNYGNYDLSNFGCAYYSGITAQLANPADWAAGYSSNTGSESARDSAMLQKYLSNVPPPMANVSSNNPTASAGTSGSGTTSTSPGIGSQ